MFCEKCGSQNADGASFCLSCGAPMNAEQTAPQTPAQPVSYQGFVPPKGNPLVKKSRVTVKSWVFMLINAAFGLLAVVMPTLPFGYEIAGKASNKIVRDTSGYFKIVSSTTSNGGKNYVNIFTEKNSWLSLKSSLNSSFKGIGIFLLIMVILSAAAIAAGIVLAILKRKGSAFCILGGSLYPFLYSYEILRLTINRTIVNPNSKYADFGYTSLPYMMMWVCIAAIVTSALSLSFYKKRDL